MTFEELLQTKGFRAMDLSGDDILFIRLGWNTAILAERERCAQIAEECDWRKSGDNTNTDIADAIRGGK